jgi:ADP-ribose pyrophosphatase
MSSYTELIKNHPMLFDNENALIRIISEENTIARWQEERYKQLIEKNQPKGWADLGVILDDPYFIVIRDLVEFPDKRMNGYCRVIGRASLQGGQAVVVLPQFQDKILLLHQYRHPTRQWHYEFPRGYGEPNTSPENNARQEIEEETGGVIEKLVGLGEFYNNTGLEGHSVSLFYAKLSSFGNPNENEGIESFIWLSVSELEDWIADAKITDGFTIAAYTKAKLKGLLA